MVSCACLLFKVMFIYEALKKFEAIPKLPLSHFRDKMKLSDKRSRDCSSLEIEIKRFVNISLVHKMNIIGSSKRGNSAAHQLALR